MYFIPGLCRYTSMPSYVFTNINLHWRIQDFLGGGVQHISSVGKNGEGKKARWEWGRWRLPPSGSASDLHNNWNQKEGMRPQCLLYVLIYTKCRWSGELATCLRVMIIIVVHNGLYGHIPSLNKIQAWNHVNKQRFKVSKYKKSVEVL